MDKECVNINKNTHTNYHQSSTENNPGNLRTRWQPSGKEEYKIGNHCPS